MSYRLPYSKLVSGMTNIITAVMLNHFSMSTVGTSILGVENLGPRFWRLCGPTTTFANDDIMTSKWKNLLVI